MAHFLHERTEAQIIRNFDEARSYVRYRTDNDEFYTYSDNV
jgi:hypothetical protein